MDARQIVDRWFSIRLGVSVADLKLGQVAVATCDRRTYREQSYSFIRLLWIVHFGDRAAVSVHPAVVAEVSRLAWGLKPDDVVAQEFGDKAAAAVWAALPGVEEKVGVDAVTLYHPGDVPPVSSDAEVRPFRPGDGDRWIGGRVYGRAADHPSALRGEAFGLWLGTRLIGEAITHDPIIADMAALVAEDGIEVSEPYRGRGYGKALLAAWTREMQSRGRVCLHSTSADNPASIGVARAVRYIEYARTRRLTYSPTDQ